MLIYGHDSLGIQTGSRQAKFTCDARIGYRKAKYNTFGGYFQSTHSDVEKIVTAILYRICGYYFSCEYPYCFSVFLAHKPGQ